MALSAFEQASPRVLVKRGLRVCSCKGGGGGERERENSARSWGLAPLRLLQGGVKAGAALQDERRAPATATTCAELERKPREDPPPRDPWRSDGTRTGPLRFVSAPGFVLTPQALGFSAWHETWPRSRAH